MVAEAVHDALIDASHRAPRLRHHRLLQGWLYAAVRRRLIDRRSAPVVWTAPSEPLKSVFGGLEEGDREVLLLTVRHGLAPEALAAVLGIGVSPAGAPAGPGPGKGGGPPPGPPLGPPPPPPPPP